MRKKNQDAQVTKSLGSHLGRGGGGGGGGHSSCNASLSQSNVQKNSRALVRGMGEGA